MLILSTQTLSFPKHVLIFYMFCAAGFESIEEYFNMLPHTICLTPNGTNLGV